VVDLRVEGPETGVVVEQRVERWGSERSCWGAGWVSTASGVPVVVSASSSSCSSSRSPSAGVPETGGSVVPGSSSPAMHCQENNGKIGNNQVLLRKQWQDWKQ